MVVLVVYVFYGYDTCIPTVSFVRFCLFETRSPLAPIGLELRDPPEIPKC